MEYITAFKTADGKLFASKDEAQNHEFGQLMSEKLDAFSALSECPYPDGVANSQMRASILAWELHGKKAFQGDTIESLALTHRTLNCLKSENILTIGDLLACTGSMLLKTPNLGRKSLNEIIEVLAARNMHLANP